MRQETFAILFLMRKGRPKKNGLAPIFARITTGGFRQEVYTQCDSNPETWNQHKERAMGTNKLAIQVNERLNDFRVKIIDIRSKLLAEGYAANAAQIKQRYLNPTCNTMMLIAGLTDYAKRRQAEVGVRITQRTADKHERLCAASNSISPSATRHGQQVSPGPNTHGRRARHAALNPHLSKPVGHVVLAFSARDAARLDNRRMVGIAAEYLSGMGIRNTQFIIARHRDREHPHLHILFNRVDNDGRTISDRNDRYRSERLCKELTVRHGLHFAPGKENVKEHRLREPDKTKYEIFHALHNAVPRCHD